MTELAVSGLLVALKEVKARAESLKENGEFTLPMWANFILNETITNADLGIGGAEELALCVLKRDEGE